MSKIIGDLRSGRVIGRRLPRWVVGAALIALVPLVFVASASSATTQKAAGAPPLLAFELRDLNSNETHHLGIYRGQPTLLMLFAPECPWCEQQGAVINGLWLNCQQGWQPLAVGVNGDRRSLVVEMRHLGLQFPAYQASGDFVRALGGSVRSTPLLLLTDDQGRYQDHRWGFQSALPLQQWLRLSQPDWCVKSA